MLQFQSTKGVRLTMEIDRLLSWLLCSSPCTEYNARLELLNQFPDDSAILTARRRMIAQPQIQALMTEVSNWPGDILNNHKDASAQIGLSG
jgi:hypothetical protein